MSLLVTIGEILIDLTQTGVNEAGIPQFSANPGGAPANAAVAAARLGTHTAFIGCVGCDSFGMFLRDTLCGQGVDVSGLVQTDAAPTTLAVVGVDTQGERHFQFYRKPGADTCLRTDMLNRALLEKATVLHFGSVSLTDSPSREAVAEAVRSAKQGGTLITYDPNYRANLWPDEATAVRAMREPLALADVVKISDEETALLTDFADPEQAASALEKQGVRLVLVTLGADGVLYRFRGNTGRVPGFAVTVADTNGAGDTFFGAVLSRLTDGGLDSLDEPTLQSILRMANCAAAITTSRPGAIPAMPTLADVNAKLRQEGAL